MSQQMVDHLNSTPVTPDELSEIVARVQELHGNGEQHEFLSISVIADLHRGDPDKASAIYFRASALARAVTEYELPGWSVPTDKEGCYYTQEDLIRAAALIPLCLLNDDVRFDKDTLINKALEIAEPEGRG